MVLEGDRVIAIGSPLNQEKIMTAGIISKVEPTAVISDVNINHGNSGGPLLNLDGQVVGINTFGDFTEQGGPGVSGSILITRALAVLESARILAAARQPPSATLLAVAPRQPFPLDSLQTAAAYESFDSKPYFISDRVGTGKFEVVAVTPIFDAWRRHRYEMELAKATKKRERKGGVPATQASDPIRGMKEWMRYTGNDYAPVITFEFTPKVGETAGSIFGNVLGAMAAGAAGSSYYRGSHRMEFKADFKDVRVTRDSTEVQDVGRFKGLQPLVFSKSTWTDDYFGADQARTGVFQCTADWFRPEGEGWPTITISVTSVEKPTSPYMFNVPAETVKRLWGDFQSYRAAIEAPGGVAVSH
jgi:Trypsin-like peptidase domain